MPIKSREALARRAEKRKDKGALFTSGRVTTERIFCELMLNRDGALASALQRVVCRAMDGEPLVLEREVQVSTTAGPRTLPAGFDLWDLDEVRLAFGNARPPETQPALFCHLSAVRCGKSQTAAAKAIEMIDNCDISMLAAGDIPMLPVLAPDKKAAKQTWQHIFGTLDQSPILRRRFAKKPAGESIWLYHPSGRVVEVTVRALSRFGTALTSRWCVGVIWDEAPRMIGAEDGAKNLTESLRAARGRVLPGGQLLLIGSPSHPFGPAFEMYTTHFGQPSEDIVICKARGDHLNPVKWTKKEQEKLLRQDPDGHRTEFLAEFGDPADAFFSSDSIERNRRRVGVQGDADATGNLPYDPTWSYVAAMDPAGRANAWTLVVLARKPSPDMRERYSVAFAKQWRLPRHRQKSNYLDSNQIVAEIKEIANSYGLNEVHTDQYAPEMMMALGDTHGLDVIPHDWLTKMQYEAATGLRTLLEEDRIEIHPDHFLREDLVRVQKRVTAMGRGVHLPKSQDGRHCDYFPALGMCAVHPPGAPGAADRKQTEEEKIIDFMTARARRDGADEFARQARAVWQQ